MSLSSSSSKWFVLASMAKPPRAPTVVVAADFVERDLLS
jgi:hypothetical protein